MTTINEFFEKLNLEMELHDPHKWTLDIEIEDIPQVIEELEEDIFNLEEDKHEMDGSIENIEVYQKGIEQSIKYKRECIDILTNRMEDDSE